VKAHSSTVWSLHVRPDGQVLVSGSADKEVKFWEFERNVSSNDEVSVSLFEYAPCNLNHESTYAGQ
jgi:U3 small nucleolar RNA-associated protein 12